MEELPNIKQNYQLYHEKGFEVVGINLDEDPAALEQFLSVEDIPWATVSSDDPNATGRNNVNAVRCGVEVPFMLLVGRDGNVAALNVPRGTTERRAGRDLRGTGPNGSRNAPRGVRHRRRRSAPRVHR